MSDGFWWLKREMKQTYEGGSSFAEETVDLDSRHGRKRVRCQCWLTVYVEPNDLIVRLRGSLTLWGQCLKLNFLMLNLIFNF